MMCDFLKKEKKQTYLVHESARVKAQAVEKHLFAEDVHFLNSDEQRGHAGPNYRAGQRSNKSTRLQMFFYLDHNYRATD